MTTALDIINLALSASGVIGVGQTPLAENTEQARVLLNMIIAQWQRKRWMVYHLVDISAVGTGSVYDLIGPGEHYNVTRPDKLEYAFRRQIIAQTSQEPDTRLDILTSYEDYATISLKTMGNVPMCVFYDSGYPVGKVYVWPVPSSSYEIHLLLKAQLQTFPNLSTEFNMPEEYQAALMYNLAVALRPFYQLPPDPSLNMLAKAAANALQVANTQLTRLKMPRGVVRGGMYNIYTDTYN